MEFLNRVKIVNVLLDRHLTGIVLIPTITEGGIIRSLESNKYQYDPTQMIYTIRIVILDPECQDGINLDTSRSQQAPLGDYDYMELVRRAVAVAFTHINLSYVQRSLIEEALQNI